MSEKKITQKCDKVLDSITQMCYYIIVKRDRGSERRSAMKAQEIIDIMDDNVNYKVGDYTANSRVWVDGEVTEEELEGTNIKEAREQEKMTQAETAKILGVSKRTIEEWERGTRNPKGGHAPLIEKIKIAGYLTPEGRAALIDGDVSWEEATSFYKVAVAKRKCSIGAFGDTFSAILDSVPESVFNALTGEQLAEVIDALKGAYDKGVAYGRVNKEDE